MMILKRIFRLSICNLLAPTVLLATSLVHAESDICCKFETDRRAVWQNTITLRLPESDASCHWHRRFPGAITFVGPNRVVAGFHFDCYAPDGRVLVHSQESLFAIDAHTGQILKQASWKDLSVNGPGGNAIQIFSVNETRVLFRAGRFLKLCAADLEEIRSRFLPTTRVHERWDAYLSPSGKIGVLKHSRPNEAQSEEQWFSTETLEPIETDPAPPYSSYIAVTDDKVYYRPDQAQIGQELLHIVMRL